MSNRYKCPHCGNTDTSLIEDNGVRRSSPDFTLLCVKPCNPAESSFDGPEAPAYCGWQWEPNSECVEG